MKKKPACCVTPEERDQDILARFRAIDLERTRKTVFWLFFGAIFFTLALTVASSFLFSSNKTDLVMMSIFFYSTLFSLVGSQVGGYVGAKAEKDACGSMDMGVLSSMGAFIGTISFGIAGSALAGLVYRGEWVYLWIVLFILSVVAFIFFSLFHVAVHPRKPMDGRGNWLDDEGHLLALPKPKQRMKNKLAVLLFVCFALVLVLSLEMARLMGTDLANGEMLAAMMYGMMGSMAGGFLAGWLAGLVDEHAGVPEDENPIMVCGMALMGGMMGGMMGGSIGGMMALMGRYSIFISIIGSVLPLVVFYVWVFRGDHRIAVVKK